MQVCVCAKPALICCLLLSAWLPPPSPEQVLLGPFVDVEQPLIAGGMIDVTFQQLFQTQVCWFGCMGQCCSHTWRQCCSDCSELHVPAGAKRDGAAARMCLSAPQSVLRPRPLTYTHIHTCAGA